MLHTLRIRHLVILQDVTVEFGPGLNLLTGETGAGKSVLVDAIGLAVGARADRGLVRSGAERAVVEALFDVTPDSPAGRWLVETGAGDPTDGELLVRREIAAEGSHRVFLNGSPCTLGLLRELGERLFDLHGQHEHQSLLSPERHLELLDRFGEHRPAVEAVGREYFAHRRASEKLERLLEEAQTRQARSLELREALREIDGVDPRPGELAQLTAERQLLQNSARVVEQLAEVVGRCYEGDPSAASLASAAARSAASLAALDPSLADLATRLQEAAVEIQDLGESFRDYRDGREFDPAQLEELEARRVALERLCLKYGEDESAILRWRENAADELAALERADEHLEAARKALESAGKDYRRRAEKLGRDRRRTARKLVAALRSQLAALALARAEVDIVFSEARGPRLSGNGDDGDIPLAPRGAERAEFLLAANPGEPRRPLARVGSGGELSRILLALHASAGGAGEGRVLVFDEVDAGIGGAVADAVGARLAELASRNQVLCVTHLPQVAAHGDRHLRVIKRSVDGRTVATIEPLSWEQRVEELARMLGGRKQTTASRRHASELLTTAARRASRGAEV